MNHPTNEAPPDSTFLVQLAGSDPHAATLAFAELYNRHYDGLYNYLLRFTKNGGLTRDLIQDIFLKLWDKRAALEIRTSLAAYLYRSARNHAINQLNRMALSGELREETLHRMNLGNAAPNTLSTDLQWNEYQRLLDKALASLTPRRREAFLLCREEGKSYKDAAAEMNISVNTLKENLSLAVRSIREWLSANADIIISLIFFLHLST